MDENAYHARRKSLEQQYTAQQKKRDAEMQNRLAAYDAELQSLETAREKEHRDAYVQHQQRLTRLPEELADSGITGGSAETGLLKLETQYGNDRAAIHSRYQNAAQALGRERRAAEEKNAADAAAEESDYYDRLAQLAQELAEARAEEEARLAEERAAEADRVLKEKLAAEERALEERLTQEKLEAEFKRVTETLAAEERMKQAQLASEERIAQAKRTQTENKNTTDASSNKEPTGSKDQHNAKDQTDSKNPGNTSATHKTRFAQQQVVTPTGVRTATKIGNELVLNDVVYDGSGQYYIVVDGERMTPAQLNSAILNRKVFTRSGAMNSKEYVKYGSNFLTTAGSSDHSFTTENRTEALGGTDRFSTLQFLRGGRPG